jgi:hypothetical protein
MRLAQQLMEKLSPHGQRAGGSGSLMVQVSPSILPMTRLVSWLTQTTSAQSPSLQVDDPFTGAGNNATRTIIVAHDKPVLVPVLNAIDVEGPGIPQIDENHRVTSRPGLEKLAQDSLKQVTDAFKPGTLTLTIDGQSISGLQSHLETTDFFSIGKLGANTLLPSDNVGVDPGANINVAKASGYFVMLEHLSRGAHTITFGGTGASGPVSTTDHLIVV